MNNSVKFHPMKVVIFGATTVLIACWTLIASAETQSEVLPKEIASAIDKVLADPWNDFTQDSYYALDARFAPFAITDHLIKIVKDSERDRQSRSVALGWLSRCQRKGACEFVESFYDDLVSADTKTWSKDEYSIFKATVISLGYCNTTTATDRLLELIKPEFWQTRNYQAEGQTPEEIISSARQLAVGAIGLSNTKKAMSARTTGEGIPVELRPLMESYNKDGKKWEEWKSAHPRISHVDD